MSLQWSTVADKIVSKIKSGVPYANVTFIGSFKDYINNNSAQAIVSDVSVFVSAPDGAVFSPSNDPMIGGFFRKRYEFEIAVVIKTDPKQINRVMGRGPSQKGISEVLSDVHDAIEHNNLDRLVDNKAGSNFEVEWSSSPNENKAITVYSTIYTAIKTER